MAAKNDPVVGKYTERPYDAAKADPKDIASVEDIQPDQIADYHEKHPTLGAKKVHASSETAKSE